MNKLNLNDHVNTLTRETTHTTEAITRTGSRYVKADSLLNQLRTAIQSSTRGAGASSNKAKLPLDVGALDLYNEINATATDYWSLFTQTHTVHGTLEHRIQSWTAHVIREEDIHAAERIVGGWVRDIHRMFNPPVIRPLQKPCPHCGALRAWVNDDGELVQAWALTVDVTAGITHRSEWTGFCANCETTWEAGNITELLVAPDYTGEAS